MIKQIHNVRLEGASGTNYARVRAATPSDATRIAMERNPWASCATYLSLANGAQVAEFERQEALRLQDYRRKGHN